MLAFMVLNDDDIEIEKPDRICSATFVVDAFSRFKICICINITLPLSIF